MTDSMKFGPEWLRNMSNDMSVGAGSGGATTGSGGGGGGGGLGPSNSSGPLGPRFQQAEYRYGREEMLSLYEKNLKLPEILPSFKKLFVERVQLPLALSPSTDDDLVMLTQRPWILRSPVSLMPTRGPGRGIGGASAERGRGRSRGVYHTSSLSFPRPMAMYDEEIRGIGRQGERGWPERNGANDSGGGGSNDWNGSPSSSPRKEYSSHGRGSSTENWRRSRVEEDAGDGWRGAAGSIGPPTTYRWSRSTSWRDDESTTATGGGGSSGIAPITRSFSSSASVSNSSAGGIDRGGSIVNSNSSGGIYKPTAQLSSLDSVSGCGDGPQASSAPGGGGGGSSGGKATNTIWDQEDMLPEWAMENATDGGGSFDASGAFVAPNDENDGGGDVNTRTIRQRRRSSDLVSDASAGSSSGGSGGAKSAKDEKFDQRPGERKPSDTIVEDKDPSSRKNSNTQPGAGGGDQQQLDSHLQQSLHELSPSPPVKSAQAPDQQTSQQQQWLRWSSSPQHAPKAPIFDLSDRMREVADDMVEKLIMDDEMNMTLKKHCSSGGGNVPTAGQLPHLKTPATNSPTGVPASLLQRPLHGGHPMMMPPPQQSQMPPPQQSQMPPSNDLWYYRDPQNKVQGPFTGVEMAEWYRSDYFDETLYVRRVCDMRFATLGELVKICGNAMPFLSSHLIPPLQMPAVVPLGNQGQGVGVVPGQQSLNQPPQQPIGNPILGPTDMIASLSLHLQYLQKEYLLRQQSIILAKLTSSESFTMLSPERQERVISQHMSEVTLPANIVNLQAFANFLYGGVNPSAYAMQQMLLGSGGGVVPHKQDLSQVKLPGQHSFMGGGHSDFGPGPSLHGLMQGNGGGQPMVPQGLSQSQQQQQLQGSPIIDEPIKNLLRQLQMPKPMQPGAPLLQANMGSKWPQNIMQPPTQQAWPATGASPVSMWDFDPLGSIKQPEMKTEQQLLEEQHQQQQLQHAEALKFAAESEQQLHQPQHAQPSSLLQPQQQQSQPQHQQSLPPQQQPQQLRSTTQKKPAAVVAAAEDKPKQLIAQEEAASKLAKIDEIKKASGKKSDKKDPTLKPKQTDEERKKDAADERKKQKEEKKRLQLEDERKRLQAQEDEKRRQMLEEKKRQEEIDQHRRVKMLENTTPKPPKQPYETAGRITSSVAPWSNSGLPGITTPAASLAEIQKAERERRAEEQRIEQHMEHQRKSQHMEMLVKAEPLKWNAQPIKSINVKSLAEIQAEEHKQQLAYEMRLAAAMATESARRSKDEAPVLANVSQSVSSSSFFTGNRIVAAAGTPTAVTSSAATVAAPTESGGAGTSGGAGSAFNSIWSSRPSSLVAWNGKAWSATSNAGFWEEPTKIPQATIGSAASALFATGKHPTGGGSASIGGGNRVLSKSQTISNIQTAATKNSYQPGGGNIAVKMNAVNNASGGKQAGKAQSTIQTGGKGLNLSVTGQQNNGSGVGKKDDARNEFTSWCIKALSLMKSTVDVPTFIGFLQDIESPYEVKDYIRMYLGETKECSEFGKQFLERRSKYKNQQRAQNAHIDDMCSPAPAINPSSNDFQEVKGKGKKVKKNKMTKLDARILGFSVTAAQDRINVGDRDYGDAT